MQEERRHTFYGFHGTAESCALVIDETRCFEFGELRDDHWLGQGAYFYNNDEEQAALWAKNKVQNHSKFLGETPYVLEVIIEVDESNFLNLDARKGLEYLSGFICFLKEKGLKIEATSYDNIPAKIRCFLLSQLPSDVWLVQRTFHNIPSYFDKQEIFVAMDLTLVGTQLCVRNNEVIRGNSLKMKKLSKPVIKKRPSGKPRLFG